MPFPPQGSGAVAGIEEATYNTWNHVWTRDYGAAAGIDRLTVTDTGTIYASDSVTPRAYVRTLAGVETNLLNYMFYGWFAVIHKAFTRTGRYQVAINPGAPAYEIWRDDVMIWSRNPVLDLADFGGDAVVSISLSGEFLAIVAVSTATGNPRYVMLYRGA